MFLLSFGHIFLLRMPSSLWLDARHCQLYLIGCHMFLYSYNSPWALFWDVVKLLGNSLIHLGLPLMSGAVLSLGLIISHFGVLYPWILSLFGFLVLYLAWPVRTGTVPGTRHCSLQSSHMVLFWPQVVFSRVWQSVLSWMFKVDLLQIFRVFSLCSSLFSGILFGGLYLLCSS